MRVIISGGAGFIGHHVVEHFLKNTDWEITVIDQLSYSTNGWDRLRDIDVFCHERVQCISYDLSMPISSGVQDEIGGANHFLHIAANSHVDRSIHKPDEFVRDNVLAAYQVLQYCREYKIPLLYFSTDEVYGSAPAGTIYDEGDRFLPGNPYAATKAAAECLCYAWANTYQMPIQITNTMNVFGERQHAEKFVPLCIRKIKDGDEIIIHADKTCTVPGSRFWIHARNVADALMFLLTDEKAKSETLDNLDPAKGKFHIVGSEEINVRDLARRISAIMGEDLQYRLVDFHSSRPGHDLRYAISGRKMAKLGWAPPVSVDDSLKAVVNWTLANEGWM